MNKQDHTLDTLKSRLTSRIVMVTLGLVSACAVAYAATQEKTSISSSEALNLALIDEMEVRHQFSVTPEHLGQNIRRVRSQELKYGSSEDGSQPHLLQSNQMLGLKVGHVVASTTPISKKIVTIESYTEVPYAYHCDLYMEQLTKNAISQGYSPENYTDNAEGFSGTLLFSKEGGDTKIGGRCQGTQVYVVFSSVAGRQLLRDEFRRIVTGG